MATFCHDCWPCIGPAGCQFVGRRWSCCWLPPLRSSSIHTLNPAGCRCGGPEEDDEAADCFCCTFGSTPLVQAGCRPGGAQQYTSWCWLAHWTFSTHLAADVVGQSKTEVLLVSETASPSLADIILGPLKQREAQGSPQQAIGLQAGATDSPVGTLSNASSWGTPTQASPLGVQGQRQHLQAPVAGSSPGKLVAWSSPAGHGVGVGSEAAVSTGWGPPRQEPPSTVSPQIVRASAREPVLMSA